MKLRYSPTSPYVRKVMVLAMETGLEGRIEIVPTNPWQAETDLPRDNPLGRVPALIVDDGLVLYDSPVICEYLDSLHAGPRLFPQAGEERWRALKCQALCDGILDASVAARVEVTMRPAQFRWDHWLDRQNAAASRGLDALEREVGQIGGDFGIAAISAAVTLGYRDFRWPDDDWRKARPALAAWYEKVAGRDSMIATRPHD